ncbi:MAG: hypothetical protein K2I47_04620 [Odoribacter sp.]|nr:hypothetical protein [Odoribacter sp.]
MMDIDIKLNGYGFFQWYSSKLAAKNIVIDIYTIGHAFVGGVLKKADEIAENLKVVLENEGGGYR